MTKLSLCFIALFGILSSTLCQNLTIEGRVFQDIYDQYPRESDTLYYTPAGKEFDRSSYVLIAEDNTYTLSIPLSKIKKNKTEVLVFSQRQNESSSKDFACTQKINIGKALKTGALSGKSPKIKTDLFLLENCSDRMGRQMREEDTPYVGTYKIEGDTLIKSVIPDALYGCTITYHCMLDNLMTEEVGSWKYDKEQNKLKISIRQQQNPDLGILLSKHKTYIFDISEKSGVIKLTLSNQ
jgi:hypothetical protein